MLLRVDKFQMSHFCNVVRASVRLIKTLTALLSLLHACASPLSSG